MRLPCNWRLRGNREADNMYCVKPDDTGKWILYGVGDGGFDLVAWFADKDDAEFSCAAFESRENEQAALQLVARQS